MTRPPNLVLIICDDLAWGDLSAHGNPHLATPHLDAMLAAGTGLTRYRSGPLCSPARASLMTGRWHLRTRVRDTYCGRSIIDPRERTLAQILAAAGYRCGHFGKWHLGDCYPSRSIDLGFHESVAHLSGGIGQPGDYPANHFRESTSYTDPLLQVDGVPRPGTGYCTDLFTDRAIDFITRNQARPFFCHLAFNAPHHPFQVPAQWAAPYRARGDLPENWAALYGMVANIDHNVGRLRSALAGLGLAEDTVVVFTSDHGPCGSANDPVRGIRFNGGLRNQKGSVYEGGIRVPCLWTGPGIGTGRLADDCHAVDILPTFAALAGAPLPAGRLIDGLDLGPRLRRTAAVPAGRDIIIQWHRGDAPVARRNACVIRGRWKWHSHETDETREQLYDLDRDPGEEHDLAAAWPEHCAELRAAYDAWFLDVTNAYGGDTCRAVPIVAGTLHEPATLLTQNDWQLLDGEGWRRDDLPGRWLLRIPAAGIFDLQVHFRPGLPPGTMHLRIGEVCQTARRVTEAPVSFPGTALPAGLVHAEAWLECDQPLASARFGRQVAALYLELAARTPVAYEPATDPIWARHPR
jgi:arylsulfatase A-like enzyme